ncbi:hypothetical protein AU252_05045 [Pseudarthrobacter sulfonivorans]|uniref:Uncharacterized protein n=1 Tax=Pseudarthrobacter sulfonivorans TaxID=121292 RepID=A0A0U3FP46_9MICC|nr:hypothetical protein AU252_05045 [Pseudarthrobacter sulfonivorans]
MVVVISAFGLLLWIAFLLVALVLAGTFWLLSNLILWLMDLKPRLAGPKSQPNARPTTAAGPKRNAPRVSNRPAAKIKPASAAHAAADIWPKWTASHRQSVDLELTLWQEKFDALDSSRHDS